VEAEEKGSFYLRAFLYEKSLPGVMEQTSDFLSLPDDEIKLKFKTACEFCEYDLEDAFSGSIDAFCKCGFFPIAELKYEVDAFMSMLIQGRYKNSRDSLRRMLEITLSSVVFLSGFKTEAEARDWVLSNSDTPFFKSNLKILKQMINKYGCEDFSNDLKGVYHRLCDYTHTKGVKYSTGIQNGNESIISNVVMPKFSRNDCLSVCKDFLDVVGWIAVLLVVHNEALLVGVDVDEAFGLNGPISGFFGDTQVKRLLEIMPPKYAEFFCNYAKTSSICISVKGYFDAKYKV
jgi:hypothetical protein